MDHFVPVLLIQFPGIPGLIEVNGNIAGELNAGVQNICIHVSPTANYYITFRPLLDSSDKSYYPVTRKLSFFDGELVPLPLDGQINVCCWPGGIHSVTLSPGVILPYQTESFPYTIYQISWQVSGNKLQATLYNDNGLHIAIENSERIVYGYSFNCMAENGSLQTVFFGNNSMLCAKCKADGIEHLVIIGCIDGTFKPMLECSGHSIEIAKDNVIHIMELNTILSHQTRNVYSFMNGEFNLSESETGWFTHQPRKPENAKETAQAFVEALREGLEAEAMGYLDEQLKSGLSFDTLTEFFGGFTGWSEPPSLPPLQEGQVVLGLLYKDDEQSCHARLFSFEIDEKACLILNVNEY